MPGLTAKVFRTYNASYTMATLLRQMNATGTIHEKVKQYNDANRRVAILCNHKRTVAAGHAIQMEKLSERVSNRICHTFLGTGTKPYTVKRVTIPEMAHQADDDRP